MIPGFFGLFSIILFIRFFDVESYGQYSLLLSQCNLIVAFSFGWLNQSLLRYFSMDSSRANFFNSQIRFLFFCIIISLIILLFLIFVQSFSIAIWLVSCLAIISIGLFNYIKTVFQASLLPKSVMTFTTYQSCLFILIPIALSILLDKNPTTLLFGVALSFFIVSAIMVINFSKIVSTSFSNNFNFGKMKLTFKKWFSYGAPISIWFAFGLALPYLDRLFINQYLNHSDLGMYASLQELLTKSFSITLFPITMALHPRIMKLWNTSQYDDVIKLIKFGFSIMFFLGIAILLFVLKFDDIIYAVINWIIPQFSINSKSLLFPLLFSGFFWQLSFITHKMLELKENTFLMILFIFPSLLINLIGNIIFLPQIGELATAYSAFLSAFVYCIITTIYSIFSIIRIKRA